MAAAELREAGVGQTVLGDVELEQRRRAAAAARRERARERAQIGQRVVARGRGVVVVWAVVGRGGGSRGVVSVVSLSGGRRTNASGSESGNERERERMADDARLRLSWVSAGSRSRPEQLAMRPCSPLAARCRSSTVTSSSCSCACFPVTVLISASVIGTIGETSEASSEASHEERKLSMAATAHAATCRLGAQEWAPSSSTMGTGRPTSRTAPRVIVHHNRRNDDKKLATLLSSGESHANQNAIQKSFQFFFIVFFSSVGNF